MISAMETQAMPSIATTSSTPHLVQYKEFVPAGGTVEPDLNGPRNGQPTLGLIFRAVLQGMFGEVCFPNMRIGRSQLFRFTSQCMWLWSRWYGPKQRMTEDVHSSVVSLRQTSTTLPSWECRGMSRGWPWGDWALEDIPNQQRTGCHVKQWA